MQNVYLFLSHSHIADVEWSKKELREFGVYRQHTHYLLVLFLGVQHIEGQVLALMVVVWKLCRRHMAGSL